VATRKKPPSPSEIAPSLEETLIQAAAVPTPRRRRATPAATVSLPMQPALSPVVGRSGVDGIPAEYYDGRTWLEHGLNRNMDGALVALFFAWTGFWVALWGAAIGAVLGVLIALGAVTNPAIAQSLLGINIGQAVSPLAIVSGLVLGIVGGFLFVLSWILIHHPFEWLIGIVCGAIVAFIVTIAVAAFERLGLRLRGYRRLSRDEVRRIAPLVKQVAEGLELDGLPRFAMVDSAMPGAWSHMRTIVLSTGLLQSLDDGEIRAVLAHELHHWRSGDAVGARVVWACAWPLALVLNLGLFLTGTGQRDRSPRGQIVMLAGWLIAWPALLILKYAVVPIVRVKDRRHEYEADAAAGQLGYSAQLSSALRKLGAFESGRTGWERTMAATHPPTELRIEALQPAKPDDVVYQEDELRGPSGAELKRLLTPFVPR
jgi:Zn-dependent protease with chaperone function